MIDTPYTKAVVPAFAVVLLIGFGIVGNPMLGGIADAIGPGEAGPDGDPSADRSGSGDSKQAASDSTRGTATEGLAESLAAEDDRRTPADAGQQMVDVFSEGDTDGSTVGTGDPDMSLLSPDSAMGIALRQPFYLLEGADSSLDRTLRALDETATGVGEAAADGEVTTDEVADGAEEVGDTVDDTVDNTTDSVDETTDTTGEVVDDTTEDGADTLDDTTNDTTDSTTDSVDDTTNDTTDSTTDSVDDTTNDTTDTVDDTTDTLTGDDSTSTPTPTPDDDGLL